MDGELNKELYADIMKVLNRDLLVKFRWTLLKLVCDIEEELGVEKTTIDILRKNEGEKYLGHINL